MAESKSSNSWDASVCKSELEPASLLMKCTCNAYKSNYAALFTDTSRVLDLSVLQFPVVTAAGLSAEEFASQQTGFKKNESFAWLITTTVLSLVLLAATGCASKLDRQDIADRLQKQNEGACNDISYGSASGINHFVMEVSRELH